MDDNAVAASGEPQRADTQGTEGSPNSYDAVKPSSRSSATTLARNANVGREQLPSTAAAFFASRKDALLAESILPAAVDAPTPVSENSAGSLQCSHQPSSSDSLVLETSNGSPAVDATCPAHARRGNDDATHFADTRRDERSNGNRVSTARARLSALRERIRAKERAAEAEM